MDLIIFWTLVLVIAVPLALLRDVYDSDARDHRNALNGHVPPRSHPHDAFDRSGSTWH